MARVGFEPIPCRSQSLRNHGDRAADIFMLTSLPFLEARFHYERGKEHFFSFIDLRLKRVVKIEASAKNINKTNKECFFPRS